jgi:alpha-tubulin suppressor-like RCC1 family protein
MTWLEELVMPQTTTSVGSYALYNNTNLAKVNSNATGEFNIPSGVTNIQPFTFYGNEALTELNVFGAVTSIGANALQGTINLLEVSLPNTTSIGAEAFKGVTSLPSLDLPEVLSIGANAFEGATGLTTLTAAKVTSIGNQAFKGATGLISISAPKLVSIGDYAFQGASSLTRFNSESEGVFNLPSTVTSIGEGAFRSVGLMTEITIPFVGKNTSSQESFEHVFGYIFGYTNIEQNLGIWVSPYTGIFINTRYGTQPAGTTWQYTRQTTNERRASYYYYIPQTLTKVTVLGGNIPVASFFNMTWLEELVIKTENPFIGSYAFNALTNTNIHFSNFISAGNQISMKALNFNELYMFGNNEGQLIESTLSSTINSPLGINFGISLVTLDSGYNFIVYSTRNGFVFSKGINDVGQLGLGNTSNQSNYTQLTFPSLQTEEKVYNVYAGYQHAAAITSSRRLFMWGLNASGQLGNGNTTNQTSPILITNTGTIDKISLGHYHTLIKNTSNQVFAWGKNEFGQVGDSTLVNKLSPVQISFANLNAGEFIADISAGNNFSLALTNQGRVYAWGSNTLGQLAASNALSRSISPRLISISNLLSGETITRIEAGPDTAYAVSSLGRVFVWGSNNNGELGHTNVSFSNQPTLLSILSNGETVKLMRVISGCDHVLAEAQNGDIYAWGNNTKGQLGLGFISTNERPNKVNFN